MANCKDLNSANCKLVDEDCADCGEGKKPQAWTKAKQFRALDLITNLGTAILDEDDLDAYLQSLASLSQTYSGTTVADEADCATQRPLDPDLTAILVEQSVAPDAQTAWQTQKLVILHKTITKFQVLLGCMEHRSWW